MSSHRGISLLGLVPEKSGGNLVKQHNWFKVTTQLTASPAWYKQAIIFDKVVASCAELNLMCWWGMAHWAKARAEYYNNSMNERNWLPQQHILIIGIWNYVAANTVLMCNIYRPTSWVDCVEQYCRVIDFRMLYEYCECSCNLPDGLGGILGRIWMFSEIWNTSLETNFV